MSPTATLPESQSTPPSAPSEAPAGLCVGYLVNQYPQASQSFIRREIAGLEAEGIRVERFTVRRWSQQLVDERDQAEQQKTRVILDEGLFGLLLATLGLLIRRPRAWFSALRMAIRVGWRSDRGLLLNLVYLLEACVLVRWCEQAGVQHVHAHFGTNSTTVALLCRLLGGPSYSFTVHGPEEFDRPGQLHLGEKIAHSAFVVAISEFGRSQLYRWCKLADWPKVQVVHCGVDDLFFDLEPTAPPEAPRLVCVGRLCEQKGPALLVQAAGRLAAEGLEFELVMVGDGDLRPEVEQLIAELDLAQHVKLVGWKSNREVREAVLAARALVLPSFAEGLPVVIMESLALHRPVISTYVAGIPELVVPGECGWLVPAGTIEPLAEAMREVLTASPGRLAEMGADGAARVGENHNAHREAARLAELFAGHSRVERV